LIAPSLFPVSKAVNKRVPDFFHFPTPRRAAEPDFCAWHLQLRVQYETASPRATGESQAGNLRRGLHGGHALSVFEESGMSLQEELSKTEKHQGREMAISVKSED